MQDLLDIPTTPQIQTTVTQDPPTIVHLPTIQATIQDLPTVLPTTQAIVTLDHLTTTLLAAHIQDLHQTVHQAAVAIQDPLTALPAAQAAEATQAPAAQDQAEVAIQEAVTQEAVHQEVHTQAAEVQEAVPLLAEDKLNRI